MAKNWVSPLNFNGVDFIMIQVEWAKVKNARDRPVAFREMESIYPGRHIVLVSRDPLSKTPAAEFFGHPTLTAPLAGRKITDFPWKQA